MIVCHEYIFTAEELPENCVAEVHITIVVIKDVKDCSTKLSQIVLDTSWVNKLDLVAQKSYSNVVNKTANKIKEIFENVDSEITSKFGEFFVSLNAQQSLVRQYAHLDIPISELWKEKISGNPGYDFHTVTNCDKISFGESKYIKNTNASNSSLKQLLEFHEERKYDPDTIHLEKLVENGNAFQNHLQDNRAYAAAFSLIQDGHKPDKISSLKATILANQHFKDLTETTELIYLIGVIHDPEFQQ